MPGHSGYAFGSDEESDEFLRREGERILAAYGNHPSFVMFALGNENAIPAAGNCATRKARRSPTASSPPTSPRAPPPASARSRCRSGSRKRRSASRSNCASPARATPTWNAKMFKQPGTMGILCDPSHPALAAFTTDPHSDWQWWHIVTRARPIILENSCRPIVRVIDNPHRNHKLALLFEVRVGRGRLLVCGDLDGWKTPGPQDNTGWTRKGDVLTLLRASSPLSRVVTNLPDALCLEFTATWARSPYLRIGLFASSATAVDGYWLYLGSSGAANLTRAGPDGSRPLRGELGAERAAFAPRNHVTIYADRATRAFALFVNGRPVRRIEFNPDKSREEW